MERLRPRFISSNGKDKDSAYRGRSPAPKPVLVGAKTRRRVRKAVADALARQNLSAHSPTVKVGNEWNGAGRRAAVHLPDDLLPPPPDPYPGDGVVRPMPRRQQVHSDPSRERNYAPAPMQVMTTPKIGLLKILRRLMVWFYAILYFQLGTWRDLIRHRDSQERRAIRLRETFEKVGGTFVKIGQQMASRLDLLPQRYCEELATMLDRFPPFPTEQAIAIIEQTTGQKLEDIFSVFDPVPIGSASIACVYQAQLRQTGEKVAVKVRRPGIRELFEADFQVLDLLARLSETLTLVRPGFTTNIRSEFRNSLSSELDFRREGRLGELFRRRAGKARDLHVNAPKVYFEFSNEEVLVQEFVSGMWLWEILNALQWSDPAGLARMRELNLNPKIIARRLLHVHYWSVYSHLSFHADPHPSNIVVRVNNELVFVDFGATGYMNKSRKALHRHAYESFMRTDPAAMAQGALMMAEPLPPMDVNAITKELEAAYYNHMIAIKSKHSPWYERTSASMYIASINIMAKHNVPAPQDILMFARATLLYDTLAARLNPRINFYNEHGRYAKRMTQKAKKRARKVINNRLRTGLSGDDYEAIGQLFTTGRDLLFRAQRLLSLPYDFAVVPFVIEKWIFAVITVIRLMARIGLLTALGVGIVAAGQVVNQQPIALETALREVTSSALFMALALILVVVHIRAILFRLSDKTRLE